MAGQTWTEPVLFERPPMSLPLALDRREEDGLSTTAATSLSSRSSEPEGLDPEVDSTGSEEAGTGSVESDHCLLVFDWDDCLFPTTILRRWHRERQRPDLPLTDLRTLPGLLTEAQKTLWDQAEAAAVKVVQQAQRLGRVLVITNSQQGWVKLSCQSAFPQLWTVLQNVPLYSARSQHETPEQASALAMAWDNKTVPFVLPVEWQTAWKQHAFHQHVDDTLRRVLAFGDSSHDRVAALSLRSDFPQLQVSHVLTVSAPTLERFHAQWQMLWPQFEPLLQSTEGMDLMANAL